jgi:hypothetical protein
MGHRTDTDSGAPGCGEPSPSVWERLVPQVVHPAKVAILEALQWMDRPLSASELVALLDDEGYYISLISYHFRHLADIGVIGLVRKVERRGATEKFYALPGESGE